MKTNTRLLGLPPSWEFLILVITSCFFLRSEESNAQTMYFADSVVSSSHTVNNDHSIDSNFYSFTTIQANSGTLLGVGAYSGHLEICFNSMVPANQTVYVKVEMEEDILEPLVGGSLGDLLATAGGTVLSGNQSFIVEAKNNGTVVLSGNSANPADFSGTSLKIVINEAEETFFAITPTMDFNSIRITNYLGALIGASTTRDFRVFSAYFIENAPNCGSPEYTSFDGSGLNLQLIQTTGAGGTNIHHAIDDDWYSYSELSLGVISTAASIEQHIYFQGTSTPGDQFGIRLSVDPQMALLNLGNNITIEANNGNVNVYNESLGNLLTPAMQDSLENGDIATVFIQPALPVDRITIHFEGFLGVNLDQIIHLHEVYKLGPAPIFNTVASSDSVCSGSQANLYATALDSNTMQVNWYSDSTLTTLVATTPSGGAFTPVITNDTTFYVTSSITGCAEESLPIAVNAWVIPAPDSSDITLSAAPEYCANEIVQVLANSSFGTTITWYEDAQATQPITSGTTGNTTYVIDANGNLSVSGLDDTNSPYTFYAAVTDPNTGCSNAPGDMAAITVTILDNPAPTTSDTLQSFCSNASPTINDLSVAGTNITWYDSNGNPMQPTDPLSDGSTYFASQMGVNGCESSDLLAISVTVLTSQGAQITGDTSQVCFLDTIVYTTQPGMTNYNWSVTGGNVIAGGTTSDDSIVIVWTNTGTNSLNVSYETTSGCSVTTTEALLVSPIACEGTDVVITKIVDNSTPFIGEHVFFTVEVENNGPLTLSNIQVSEQILSGYTYVNHTASEGSYNETTGIWDIPSIGANSTVTLVIEVIVNPSGDYSNTAQIITDIPEDGNGNNNSITIELDPGCLNVFNEITPNNDGMNDFFHIECIEDYPGNSLTIFNRFGNPVYSIQEYQNDWSGVANVGGAIGSGQLLPSGTYFYVLKIDSEQFEKSGWLYLLKAQ